MSATAAPKAVAGKLIGPTGYGLMGLTRGWSPLDYADATKAMKTALDKGANFWNGGMFYGPPNANSLQLLHHYFSTYPGDADKVVLSVKGAYNYLKGEPDGSPEGLRAAVAEAVRVLDGVKKIDVFEMARVDPKVPIETSVGALAELVKEGAIGGIGLSEVNGNTIRRAAAVHPISAVEIELSLFSTDPLTNGTVATCHELGVPVVAYSPLSRGFLTGQLQKFEDIPENDFRRHLPRFQPDVFGENLKLVEAVKAIAKRKGATTAQVAIAWVRAQGTIPIPGATTVDRINENYADVTLDKADLEELSKVLAALPIAGARYPGKHQELLDL